MMRRFCWFIILLPASCFAQDSPARQAKAPTGAGATNPSGGLRATVIISTVKPIYPLLARTARVTGVDSVDVVLGTDGYVEKATVVSGHPLLVQAALDAVKQYVYKPTIIDGKPIRVKTNIDVNFYFSN